MLENIVPVLHNVYSNQKVIEAARLVYGLGYKTFVITKASGTAAQSGVPEAHRLALKEGRNIIYLSDIDDAIELLDPQEVYLVVAPPYASNELDPSEIANKAREGRVLLIFGGSEPGLTRKELERGKAIYPPGIEKSIGTTGLMAITLYLIKRSST